MQFHLPDETNARNVSRKGSSRKEMNNLNHKGTKITKDKKNFEQEDAESEKSDDD
jgi:hypothetical protein